MNEKYNHDELNKKLEELSVPDEEQAWQKMKVLLDKDKKDDRIVPPFFLTCAGWALLILFTAGGIFIFWPSSEDNPVSTIEPVEKRKIPAIEISRTPQAKSSSKNASDNKVFSVPSKNKDDQNPGNKKEYQNPATKNDESLITKVIDKGRNKKERKKTTSSNPQVFSRLKKNKARTLQPEMNDPLNQALTQRINDNSSESNIVIKTDSVYSSVNETLTQSGKDSTSANNIVVKQDSGQMNDSTTFKKTGEDSLVSENELVTKKQEVPKFNFAAGLSVQQQIPLHHQSLTSYSVNGRKSLLADYLPAIYLRFYKENKWFVQADFRYGAPQATKELSYRSTTTRDNVRRTTTTATLRLKKTFYHQLPFSFNYSQLPNFSLGAGGMFSRFEGAVSEIELRVRNNQTNAETITKNIMKVPPSTDSAFIPSQWHYLLQAEYSWKKWGLGFRYTRGIQPFILYVENGIMKEEKNHSLQVSLRYNFLKRPL